MERKLKILLESPVSASISPEKMARMYLELEFARNLNKFTLKDQIVKSASKS